MKLNLAVAFPDPLQDFSSVPAGSVGTVFCNFKVNYLNLMK
jgi:hypothetical protein